LQGGLLLLTCASSISEALILLICAFSASMCLKLQAANRWSLFDGKKKQSKVPGARAMNELMKGFGCWQQSGD
jgi:hypothetical protein